MNVRKVQGVRKNVEHQYITEDSKTRIYLSVQADVRTEQHMMRSVQRIEPEH